MANSRGDQYLTGTIKTRVLVTPATASAAAVYETRDKRIIFSCPNSVAEWLGIEAKYKLSSNSSITIKAHTRSKGTVGAENTESSTVIEHERAVGAMGRQGSKVALITTGKKRASGKGNYQISFRFPAQATAIEISDLLGSVIPASKVSATPEATQIQNRYRLKGGRVYGIMTPAQADASTEAAPVDNTQEEEAEA